jgi:murein DD-endopeptidase MepM/ murein hydrolase activator NlpD
MSRLLLFLFGIAVGAAGMYALYWNGNLPLSPPGIVAKAPPASPNPGLAPLPPTSDIELPPAPAVSSAQVPAIELLPAETLAPPQAQPAPAASSADSANASEESAPSTPEAAAAVTAANSTGALLIPVQGVQAAKLTDTFTQARGTGRLHDAIDIMAARGTPVLAVADGRVAKLFTSKPGGLTVYQFDREDKLAYYYAHLDRYADGLAEGRVLKRGEVLGYVGSTGNASPDAPHLHFAVFVLGPEKKWWQGTAVNPYPLLGGR